MLNTCINVAATITIAMAVAAVFYTIVGVRFSCKGNKDSMQKCAKRCCFTLTVSFVFAICTAIFWLLSALPWF